MRGGGARLTSRTAEALSAAALGSVHSPRLDPPGTTQTHRVACLRVATSFRRGECEVGQGNAAAWRGTADAGLGHEAGNDEPEFYDGYRCAMAGRRLDNPGLSISKRM
jgi:hypothetical protein